MLLPLKKTKNKQSNYVSNNKTPLWQMVEDAPLYRRPLEKSLPTEDYIIYCRQHSEKEAYEYLTERLGKPPLFFLFHKEKKKIAKKAYGDISYKMFSEYPDYAHCSVIVYGNMKEYLAMCNAAGRGNIRNNFLYVTTDKLKISSGQCSQTYWDDCKNELETLYSSLEDEESRKTLASIIKARVTGNHGYLRVSGYPEYQHPLVNARHADWVIDGGAANGKTSVSFAEFAGKKAKVIAVEPDADNIEEIKEIQKEYKNIEIAEFALGIDKEILEFQSGMGGSSAVISRSMDGFEVQQDGIVKVECVSLETLHKEYSLKGIGIISMDVEGSELTVLENDINFLKKERPIIQVSMYHRTTDLIDLFMILKNELDNYAYFLGHHKAKHTETDLYCMPRELMK